MALLDGNTVSIIQFEFLSELNAMGLYLRWNDGTERVFEYKTGDYILLKTPIDYFIPCGNGEELTQKLRDYPFRHEDWENSSVRSFYNLLTNADVYGGNPRYSPNYEAAIQAEFPSALVLYSEEAIDGAREITWHAADFVENRELVGFTRLEIMVRKVKRPSAFPKGELRNEFEIYTIPAKETIFENAIQEIKQNDLLTLFCFQIAWGEALGWYQIIVFSSI